VFVFVYLFFGRGNIRAEYMQYTLPVAVIILLLLMICVHAHFIQRIDSFGVNAGYYLSGDGGWAGQMQPAAASVDGDTGLVPAPKAGQQNSYLRGDGKWIQANNAPTAAHYLFTATVVDQDTGPTPTYLIKYPTSGYSVISSNSTVIAQPNVSTFVLQPGYVYKCMAGITLATDAGTYINAIQFFSTTGVAYGVSGSILGTTAADTDHLCTNSTTIAYIAPTATLALNVLFTNRAKANNILTGIASAYATSRFAPISGGTWVSIEVISNNNTITAFTGATSAADGFIGYIPTPKAGQQNYVLTGGGNWAPPVNTYLQPIALANQNVVSFTSIPPAATEITVMFTDVSIPARTTSDFMVRLGYGEPITWIDRGYICTTMLTTDPGGAQQFTAGLGIWTNQPTRSLNCVLRIIPASPSTNIYLMSLIGTCQYIADTIYPIMASGSLNMSGRLTGLYATASTGNSAFKFGGGSISVKYTM
jgi:hypothetical protein